jgi:hypothetical protein
MLRDAFQLLACLIAAYIFVSVLRIGLPRVFKWIVTAGEGNE